jgi:hypothetical protein
VLQVREQYEALTVVRQDVKLAESLIKRVDDRERRARLREAYSLIEAPLSRAIAAGHQFIYDDMRDYLERASAADAARFARLWIWRSLSRTSLAILPASCTSGRCMGAVLRSVAPWVHADADGTVNPSTIRSTARLCSSMCPTGPPTFG